jgi:flagellar hook-associated protein 3 FlgL
MVRVSETSSSAAVQYTLGKNKSKLEDLQLKGSTLKNIKRPSDNPLANSEAMTLTMRNMDNKQYLKNIDQALNSITATEQAVETITDIMVKVKELAIAHSSDFYDADVRKNVSSEINQLKNQLLAIANTRIGNRYLFSGNKTLEQPFSSTGDYLGDLGVKNIEVNKDFFMPVNLNGADVFFENGSEKSANETHPLSQFEQFQKKLKINENEPIQKDNIEDTPTGIQRNLASVENNNSISNSPHSNQPQQEFKNRSNLFGILSIFHSALENNDPEVVQGLLEKIDSSINRLITQRTKIGSAYSTIIQTKSQIEAQEVNNDTQKSKLVDADIGELFSDLTKQQQVLDLAYKTSNIMMNQNLMSFIK